MTTTTNGHQPVHIGQFAPGSPEWHDLRRYKLGGSEISAVLGLSPYQSRFSLWWQKKGMAKPQEENPYMYWGRQLESVIAKHFESEHPEEIWRLGACGSYTHPERGWQLASPDGTGSHGSIVEIKTALYDLEWGAPGTDEIPVGYRAQVLHNMVVLGADRCWVPVLIRGHDYREYLVEMNGQAQSDAEIITAAGADFIHSLINDHEPPIDGSDATYQVLRERHPSIEPGTVEIDQALRDAFLEASVAKREVKEIWNLAASEILELMGNSRDAIGPDGMRFAYRSSFGKDSTPFLRPVDKIVKSMRPNRVIKGVGAV